MRQTPRATSARESSKCWMKLCPWTTAVELTPWKTATRLMWLWTTLAVIKRRHQAWTRRPRRRTKTNHLLALRVVRSLGWVRFPRLP
ncbi:hypothetical protein PPTG_20343 [Phytophthora nicotianae INRA-310]|uniref:Uncharacterized protein n=1 Tax=Phytophthora nicotianae (strain INRA-310) TaxID=761204 RepID=W2P9L8_PHYN3|nr:hypothetical protein PPTG_20343 [Phytophthora nicotianae INRA-310]ETM97340.1 hypothetical protein PPTG_20343 [Phytophthora nicotianae INRA-310]